MELNPLKKIPALAHVMFHVGICYTVVSVPCSLVITCWDRAYLLAFLFVEFSCVFVTLQYGVLGQVLYLIVLNPDHCLPFKVNSIPISVHCGTIYRLGSVVKPFSGHLRLL